MGNRELKDPLIFKDFRESKTFHNYTHQEVRTNFMVLSNNIMPQHPTEEVEEMAEAIEV
jgi:hypothetical protein